ncbi:flagellar brake protein [Massilia agri]|uniref:Flagellar brake protein n=1 Tax=Massilia agri TaxID=1886785 RepID=A0ABT2AI92_9BURK|nr:flagellar brake protein [Massilia agri]MCS0595952.1 flagellar brake protein [Massilia agri]
MNARPMNSQVHELKAQEFEFEAMNLQVGMRLQFITHRQVKPVQHFSTLIGYVKDEYIIVKIPMEHGAPITLGDGERVTIRVFSGVNVCSFACTVERVFPRPLFYAHLSFPTAIQGTSLRGAARVKADIPVSIKASGIGAATVHGSIVDVSVTGVRIHSAQSLPPDGEEVTLDFTVLPPSGTHAVRIETRAIVRNRTASQAAGESREVFSYGVQFVDLDPMHYTLLQNLTYEALLADRLKIV